MRRNITPQIQVLFVLVVATLLLSIIRLHFGVEITDEAFYVAEPYIISQGAIPIVNIWSQSPTFPIITAPLVYSFTRITGDMEGIMLFMRYAFTIFKLLIAVNIFFLMKKYIKQDSIIMFLLPFIIFTPYSTPGFSYNTLSIMLLMLSNFYTIAAFLEINRKYRLLYAATAGIIMALSVLSYPIQIITCIAVFIAIFIIEKVRGNTFEISISYCINGLSVALAVTSILSSKGGGIENLTAGLHTILYDNPYFLLKEDILTSNIPLLKGTAKMYIELILIALTIFAGFIGKSHIKRDVINKYLLKKLMAISLIISVIIYIIIISILGYKSNSILNNVCAIIFPLPIVLLLFIREKREVYYKLIWFIWLPSLLWLITSSVFALGAVSSRYYALYAGSLLSIPFSIFVLDEIHDSSALVRNSKYILSVSLTLMFVISFGINYYMFVYRDEPISKLDYRINSGIYAGMYTSRERGKAIEVLEQKLKEYTNENETVLFMETVPMAYLMSKARHCTPSTWDITLYSYGFNDDTLLQKYFDTINAIPDKIIYIYTGRDEVLSIEKEDHKFNNFVNEHYKLIYKGNEPLYNVIVFGRNNI